MSDRAPRDDEELEALLSELESTLAELRRDLDAEREAGGPRRRPRPPRPPSVGDLLRFTNDYTIPTVIATLQATIEALQLLRRFLELTAGTDRDRGRTSAGDGSILSPALSSARDRAASDATDALGRLRTALAEADLPEDEESRDVIEDARSLSERIEERIADSRETVARERDRERSDEAAADGAVVIDVTEGKDVPSTSNSDGADDDDDGRRKGVGDDQREADDGDDAGPEVDVEAELRSIKEQLGKDESPDGPGATDDQSDSRNADESEADDGSTTDGVEPGRGDDGEADGSQGGGEDDDQRGDDASPDE